VLGNGLNRTLKMIGSYRGALLPVGKVTDPIDHDLAAKITALAGDVRAAYARLDFQAAAKLPIDLALADNGNIYST
jgi:methionyl-tRNA synthetase